MCDLEGTTTPATIATTTLNLLNSVEIDPICMAHLIWVHHNSTSRPHHYDKSRPHHGSTSRPHYDKSELYSVCAVRVGV